MALPSMLRSQAIDEVISGAMHLEGLPPVTALALAPLRQQIKTLQRGSRATSLA